MTDISRIAELLPEPADGTRVVLIEGADREAPRVVWRHDDEARRWDGHDDERWFDDDTDHPMCWSNITHYATAAYVVPDEPTAHV
jgi:hypothetical protein